MTHSYKCKKAYYEEQERIAVVAFHDKKLKLRRTVVLWSVHQRDSH